MRRAYIITFFVLIMLVCSGCEKMTEVKNEAVFPQHYSGTLQVNYEGADYTFAVSNNEKGSYIEPLTPEDYAGLSYEIPYSGEIVINYRELSYKTNINMLSGSSVIMRLHSALQYPEKLKPTDDGSFSDGEITLKIITSNSEQ